RGQAVGDVAGQGSRLEAFEVYAKVDALLPAGAGHATDVGVNCIQVDERLRGVEGVQRLARRDGHSEGFTRQPYLCKGMVKAKRNRTVGHRGAFLRKGLQFGRSDRKVVRQSFV